MELPDGKPGFYYVTVRDGGKTAFLLGPFVQGRPGTLAHRQALGMVQACWRAVGRIGFRGAAFVEYGTARLPIAAASVPAGKLGRARITFGGASC